MHVCMFVKWMHTVSVSTQSCRVSALLDLLLSVACITLQVQAFCTPFVKEMLRKRNHTAIINKQELCILKAILCRSKCFS